MRDHATNSGHLQAGGDSHIIHRSQHELEIQSLIKLDIFISDSINIQPKVKVSKPITLRLNNQGLPLKNLTYH